MADEIGLGLIGTMPIGGSGSGALPGTFNTITAESPQTGQVANANPKISQVAR